MIGQVLSKLDSDWISDAVELKKQLMLLKCARIIFMCYDMADVAEGILKYYFLLVETPQDIKNQDLLREKLTKKKQFIYCKI